MKSIVVNVKMIVDQYDDSDPVQHLKKELNKVNALVGDFGGTEPRIFIDKITAADIEEINIWDED
jgi:hypothetical protein